MDEECPQTSYGVTQLPSDERRPFRFGSSSEWVVHFAIQNKKYEIFEGRLAEEQPFRPMRFPKKSKITAFFPQKPRLGASGVFLKSLVGKNESV